MASRRSIGDTKRIAFATSFIALTLSFVPSTAIAQASATEDHVPIIRDSHLSKMDVVRARVTKITDESKRWWRITSEITEVYFGTSCKPGDSMSSIVTIQGQGHGLTPYFYPALRLGDEVIWAVQRVDGGLESPQFRQSTLGLKNVSRGAVPVPLDLRKEANVKDEWKKGLFATIEEMRKTLELDQKRRWKYLEILCVHENEYVSRWAMCVIANSFPKQATPILKDIVDRDTSDRTKFTLAYRLWSKIEGRRKVREELKKEFPKEFLEMIKKEEEAERKEAEAEKNAKEDTGD